MKTIKEIIEEIATNNAGNGKIASIGVGEDGEPPGKPKNRVNGEKRKKMIVRRVLSMYS